MGWFDGVSDAGLSPHYKTSSSSHKRSHSTGGGAWVRSKSPSRHHSTGSIFGSGSHHHNASTRSFFSKFPPFSSLPPSDFHMGRPESSFQLLPIPHKPTPSSPPAPPSTLRISRMDFIYAYPNHISRIRFRRRTLSPPTSFTARGLPQANVRAAAPAAA